MKTLYFLPVFLLTTAASFLLLTASVPNAVLFSLADGISLNVLYAGLAFSLRYPARFLQPVRGAMVGFWVKQIAAAVIVTFLIISLQQAFMLFIVSDTNYAAFLEASLQWRFITGFLITAIIQALVYLYVFWERSLQQAADEAELRAMVSEAELKSLKFQINPHFLFNSLNSVAALTVVNPAGARDMVIKLAELLRSTLAENLRQMSTLAKELETGALYMAIEQVRFGEQLSYSVDLESGATDMLVPNMILQPLLENAVKHGMHSSVESVAVRVHAQQIGGIGVIRVENTFSASPARGKPGGEGVGIKNIRARLKLLYGNSGRAEAVTGVGTYSVILYIPQ